MQYNALGLTGIVILLHMRNSDLVCLFLFVNSNDYEARMSFRGRAAARDTVHKGSTVAYGD